MSDKTPTKDAHPLQRPILLVAAALGALTALSATAGAGLAAVNGEWFMLGFEAVVLIASVLCVLTGLGRFRQGPAIALLCYAGTFFAASFLGALRVDRSFLGPLGSNILTVNVASVRLDVDVLLLIRAATAGIVGAASGLLIMLRDLRASLTHLLRGTATGVALVAVLAGAWAARGTVLNMHMAFRATLVVIAGLIVVALIAATVHLFIRAFQCNVETE